MLWVELESIGKRTLFSIKKNLSLEGSMSQLALDWASLGCVLVVLFLCVPRSFYLFSSLVLWISVFYISSCCLIDTFASSGPVGILDLARHFTSFSFFQCLQLHFPVDLTFRLKWNKTLSDSHVVITGCTLYSPLAAHCIHQGNFKNGTGTHTPQEILIHVLWSRGSEHQYFLKVSPSHAQRPV